MMSVNLLSIVFGLLCGVCMFGSSFAFSPNNYNVACNVYAYWVFVPLDINLVKGWLPSQVTFGSHPFNLSSSVWPVLLEFNNPTNCKASIAPFIEIAMLEWKLEVPFLKQEGLEGPLMFKPLTYENNGLNVLATKFEYGINAVYPENMSQNNNTNPGTYAVVAKPNQGLIAQFSTPAGSEDFIPVSQAPYAQPFVDINDATEWIGYTFLFHQEQCAKIYYQWQESVVRPVTANIHIDANYLPNSAQSFDYSSQGGIQAIQIKTVEHITSLDKCTPSQ